MASGLAVMMGWNAARGIARLIGIGAAIGWAGAASAQSCADETRLRSDRPGTGTELSFRNGDSAERRIYWLDAEGRRRFYGAVDPGNVYRQPTSEGHVWVVTDEAERCLTVVTAGPAPRVVDLGGSGPSIAAPPPGIQQPIQPGGGAPPSVGMAPPPMSPVAPLSPVVSPTATSPIELFQLAGFYQLASVGRSTEALNNLANGSPELVRVQSGWESSHWEFEEVAGTPYVRIRNRWKGTYLADVRGALRAAASQPDEADSHWAMEPVEDAPYARLFNVGSQRYLISIRSGFDMVEEPPRDTNGFWQLNPVVRSPVARQVSAPAAARVATLARIPDPERSRAYEAAVDNCAELGGYWTGSTCRAFRGSRPQSCGRGWAWSEDAGECQWDGGDRRQCPPWMLGTPPNCQAELSCLGGNLRVTRSGYQSCDCPPGTAMRGAFPNFRCAQAVGSLPVFVVPFLGTFTGNNFNPPPRPVVNPGGPGRTDRMCNLGEPARGCLCPAPNAVQNGFCVRPAAARVCNGGDLVSSGCTCAAPFTVQNGRCVGASAARACNGGDLVSSGCSCIAPLTVQNGRCVGASAARACNGGELVSSGCSCIAPLTVQNGRCVGASAVRACNGGDLVSSGCTCIAPLTVQNGRCVGASSVRVCNAGERISAACECQAPLRNDNGICKTVAAAPTPPTCGPNELLRSNCICPEPRQIVRGSNGNICGPPKAVTAACTDGQKLSSGCTCNAPLVRVKGECVAPRAPVARACAPGEDTAAGCECRAPMQTTSLRSKSGTRVVCQAAQVGAAACTPGQLLSTGCNCTSPLVRAQSRCLAPPPPTAPKQTVACTEGQSLSTGCKCNAPLQQVAGNICGKLTIAKPTAPVQCREGQNVSSGCLCGQGLSIQSGGVCGKPKPVQQAACREGQSLNSGCKCNAPLQQVAGNICGKLTIAKPTTPTQCREGQNVSTNCLCGNGLQILPGGVCGKPKTNNPPPPTTPPKVNQGGGGGPPNQRACAVGEKIATGCRCQPPNGVGFSPQGAICKAN